MNSELTERTDIRESPARHAGRLPKNPYSSLPQPKDRESASSFRGWILYDGDCPSCTASARRFDRIYRRRGFHFLPLQTQWVMQQLGLEPGAPLEEMHVLTNEGENIAGAEAVILLARQIWWAWPFVLIAQLPGTHSVLERGYRWVAARRGCNPITCDLKERRLSSHGIRKTADWRQVLLDVLPGWIALIALPISVLPLRDRLASWQFMWLMAGAIFYGCKWFTAWRAQRTNPRLKLAPTLGYFFAWPGMDAEKFMIRPRQNSTALSRQVSEREPWRDELPLVLNVQKHLPPLVAPITKISLGAASLFFAARFAHQPLLAGWIGMIGMILLLHFGLFQLLAIGWHKAGIDAEPVMNAPLRSKTLNEFWGRRWNSAFSRLAFEFVSRPVTRLLRERHSCDPTRRSPASSTLHFGVAIATLAAFLVSGLIHELVISLPAGAGYGLPTAYFLLQGIGILLERAFPQIRGRIFTILITAVPAFWLFHPPFVHRVILPFMKAIGAL
jgi:predicted DCC family thiol-disulfide oxidoreductase YuxK